MRILVMGVEKDELDEILRKLSSIEELGQVQVVEIRRHREVME